MSRYMKSITAFLTLLGTWGSTAAADGHYDQLEWWGLTGVLVGTLAVFQLPNRPPKGRRRKPNVSEQDGAGELRPILITAAAVLLALVIWSLIGVHTDLY